MDPYFVLPILSTTFTFLNISYNPNMGGAGMNQQLPFMKYIKFMPFFSLPVVLFFPSALTLYWAITAFTQLIVTLITRSSHFKRILKIPEFFPGTELEKLKAKHAQKIISTIIVDNAQKKDRNQENLKKILNSIAPKQGQKTQKDAKPTTALNSKIGEPVFVYTHNPTKKTPKNKGK